VSGGRGGHRSGLSRWLGWGALCRLLAGALAPFQTVATVVEGSPPTAATVGVGIVVHTVLSALFGLIFAALLAPLRWRSAGWLAWAGLLFGGAVYVIDFQVIARISAFLQEANQPLELAAHLVFGSVLAALLLLAKPHGRPRGRIHRQEQ
jgi:hypothetical protein